MGSMPKSLDLNMQFAGIPGTSLEVSRISIGTWAIGGWMWGGSEEKESIETIRTALDQGITVIDTAPVYGFGRSEEIVGRALAASGLRSRAIRPPPAPYRRFPRSGRIRRPAPYR